MASINVMTRYIEFSSADFFYSYTTTPCRTTFANFGPVTNHTAPPACQSTAPYSGLHYEDTSLFRCPDPLAYKSCMPDPYLGLLFSAQSDEECDQIYTFHSPALACPTGWSLGAQYILTMSEKKDGETVSSRAAGAGQNAPDGRYPALSGTHRLCCPSSYQLTGGASYGCRSLGYASTLASNASFCSLVCDPEGITGCQTITTNIQETATSPIALITYGVEAVYLIGDGPPEPREEGMSSTNIALAATFSVLGALSIIILLLVLMRRRYVRRRKDEQPSEDLELPKYSRRDPDPLAGLAVRNLRAYENERTSGRHSGSTSRASNSSDEGSRSREESRPDAPPAYDSPQVWEGDGSRLAPSVRQLEVDLARGRMEAARG